jgi:hypothetical protein
MGHVERWFGSKDFPFEAWLPDDGTDVGGGMQPFQGNFVSRPT